MDEQLIDALYKKAIGYCADEETVEYSGEGEVVKRKVATKHYPPDISALKAYVELSGDRMQRLSNEELEREKIRLIGLLKEGENGA
ncbi:MAG: hypothetical protein EOM87_05025 [Clostridia bacterium]|nr:hypothetical protein [Clostridia bacterium]